jgi:hypothetical protein
LKGRTCPTSPAFFVEKWATESPQLELNRCQSRLGGPSRKYLEARFSTTGIATIAAILRGDEKTDDLANPFEMICHLRSSILKIP